MTIVFDTQNRCSYPCANQSSERKNETTSEKIIRFVSNSVIFKAIAIISASVAFTTSIITLIPASALTLSVCSIVCFASLSVLYICKHFKEILFEVSLIYTQHTTKHWFDEITPNIVLGALPLHEHFDAIKNENVNSILSMVDAFELENETFDIIHGWQGTGLDHKHIETPDFIGVENHKIQEGVEFLEQQIQENKKVYVHCKAGRGRSASVVAAYLLKHGVGKKGSLDYIPPNADLLEIYTFLKSKRPQVNLNRNQQNAIKFWNNLRLTQSNQH